MEAIYKSFIYKYLSYGFHYPNEDIIQALKEGAKDFEISLKSLNYHYDINKLMNALDKDIIDLQTEYTSLFLIGLKAPSFETAYELDKTSRRAAEIADIEAFYKAFGLEITEKMEPDRIEIELEFLSLLLQKKYFLHKKGDEEGFNIVNEAYTNFLKDHTGRWYEAFVKLLEENSEEELYKELGRLLKIFLDEETKGLKIDKIFSYKEETLKESSWQCEPTFNVKFS